MENIPEARRRFPCSDVPHKTNGHLYKVTPKPKEAIQLEPNDPDYKLHPQFVVRFFYHLKSVSGYPQPLSDDHPHHAKIDLNFQEEESGTWSAPSVWLDNLHSTFEDSKKLISPSLSGLGIKGKYQDEIVGKVVKCVDGITSRSIKAGGCPGGICIPIIVNIVRLKAVWRCKAVGRCWAEIGLRQAKESTTSELLNDEFPNYYLIDNNQDYPNYSVGTSSEGGKGGIWIGTCKFDT